MLAREDSPIAPAPGIVSVNPQQAASCDRPSDSFRNPFYRYPILLWRLKNEGMTEMRYSNGE
jgi:hypothetical protein